MKLRRVLIILIALWAFVVVAQRVRGESGVYHGTVVDEDTGEPLEGAVVVVLWFKKPWLAMDGPQYFHKGTEVLTNADGKFSISASPGVNLNPFTFLLDEPEVVIFKLGYGPMTGAYPRNVKLVELKAGATVRLPKLKTREELRRFSSLGSLGIGSNTPNRKIPNLIRLVNIQSKQVGLDPYPER